MAPLLGGYLYNLYNLNVRSQPPIALLLHWQARVTIAWLDDLTTGLSREDPDDEQMGLMRKTVTLGCGFCGGDGIEKHITSTVCYI